MKEDSKSRSKSIHLYNPKKEGVGAYDAHYINAYRKNKSIKNKIESNRTKRCAA